MTTYNTPFMQKPDAGLRLTDGRSIFDAVTANNANTAAYAIAAAGTNQATATQLTSVINQVDTVTASSGVGLPISTGTRTTPFQICYVINNGANPMQVYAAKGSTDTIAGNSASVGVVQPTGINVIYVSAKPGVWEAFGANIGPNGATGTLTLTGTTPVTVTNTAFNTSSIVAISLNTVGGTVGAQPHLATTSAGSFTVVGTALDTSVYNYTIVI